MGTFCPEHNAGIADKGKQGADDRDEREHGHGQNEIQNRGFPSKREPSQGIGRRNPQAAIISLQLFQQHIQPLASFQGLRFDLAEMDARLRAAELLRLLAYLPWLAWQIVLASLQVARVVLDPALPVAPREDSCQPGKVS